MLETPEHDTNEAGSGFCEICCHQVTSSRYAAMEELKEYLIVERVGIPLRNQMSGRQLNALAMSFFDVITRNSNLFCRLGVDQWARIMGRTLRWLRYLRAKAKASACHDS